MKIFKIKKSFSIVTLIDLYLSLEGCSQITSFEYRIALLGFSCRFSYICNIKYKTDSSENMCKKFLHVIEKGIRENWDRSALTNLGGESYLYSEFAEEIAKLHILFHAIGLQKGDKVAICDKNSAHWAIGFFATMTYGAVITSILHEFGGESIEYIVTHSEAKLLLVGKQTTDKVRVDEMPTAKSIIMLEDFSFYKSATEEAVEVQKNIEQIFEEKYPNGFTSADIKFHDEQPNELAMLNYTSGTTSNPKGVMISYHNLWSNSCSAIDETPFMHAGDGMVCMLPMAHMYGLGLEVFMSISKGCHLHFLSRPPSPQVILDAFARVKPKLVVAVPLILEKIIQKKVFPHLKKFPVNLLVKIPLFRKNIYKKIADKLIPLFGENLVEVAVGGAGLNQEVGKFLSAIKFPYTVGYGMTECAPLISYTYWETYKPSSCGLVVDRMQVRIDSNNPTTEVGEIQTTGDNVMLGYFKNEEATKEILTEDGWLKTGDLGIMDADGHIFIKGRSKTMILGSSGQNIFPEEIEGFYNNSLYVSESLIIEEGGKLIVLIFPDKDYMVANEVLIADYPKVFTHEMKAINKQLPQYSQVVNFRIQEVEFEKTPKRSIKRFLYQR